MASKYTRFKYNATYKRPISLAKESGRVKIDRDETERERVGVKGGIQGDKTMPYIVFFFLIRSLIKSLFRNRLISSMHTSIRNVLFNRLTFSKSSRGPVEHLWGPDCALPLPTHNTKMSDSAHGRDYVPFNI